MKSFLLITTVLFINIVSIFGQKIQNLVIKKFIKADSVILISHLPTNIQIVDSLTEKRIGSFKLVEKNNPNYKLIKESIRLSGNEVDSIVKILITANKDSIIEDIKCFIPHHGILIFKKSKCSYFDICFSCRHFVTSKDIKLSDELCDKTWNDLESFFRNKNLKYAMVESETEFENGH